MRVVSFVEHLEFDFEGNILKNAVCLGDIDNDGLNELVIGNEKGDLAIYKGECRKPIYSYHCTGVITAVVVGDIYNIKKNVLVVITNSGVCYIFDFTNSINDIRLNPSIHSQAIPPNIKTALIGDVNGDGYSELVVAMTDRVVRAYSWLSSADICDGRQHQTLVGLNKWELSDQIGTLSFNKSSDGKNTLLVAQPGGTFYSFKCDSSITGSDPAYHPLASARLRNKYIHTEIYGNIKLDDEADDQGSPYAVATLDGTLMLVHNDSIKWNLQVDHQLFALSSLDINKDGNEELIACAWDGNTYIVSFDNKCVRYTFPEPVNSFTAGLYGYKGKKSPCLVYVTMTGRIFIYYDIYIPHMEPHTLNGILKNNTEYLDMLEKLNINVDDPLSIRKLHRKLLFNH